MISLLFVSGLITACSEKGPDNNGDNTDIEEVVPGTNHKILIAYFSEPLPDGIDAVTSASRVIVDGDLYGSVQYVATVIQEATGGDMIRIQTAQPYPDNFDDLAAQADNERQNDIHPTLATEIDNFDDYEVIFVGYPMYSFFDKFDCSGKTLIPFSTHGGSGWSGTLEDIRELVPDATMVDGYSISRNNTATSRDGVLNWLREIGMTE